MSLPINHPPLFCTPEQHTILISFFFFVFILVADLTIGSWKHLKFDIDEG